MRDMVLPHTVFLFFIDITFMGHCASEVCVTKYGTHFPYVRLNRKPSLRIQYI